ncbi:Signal transduction histidine kinase [Thioclava dalianensis]|uniref:ATP-binding protein n=1 Tax=Thioclava dalianensis TaxID=1185766 RepID=UPI00068CAA00|nr:ATP-binding protein [Thioclava dalianensis]SFM82328.1 Signal transduction histidine kinase [Thioclava dalianensis]
MDAKGEIDRLLEVEYSNWIEVVFRFGLSIGTVAVLYFYTGWISTLVWIALYIGGHLPYYLFLKRSIARPSEVRLIICIALYLSLSAVFLSMPVYLIGYEDIALRVPGTVALVGYMMFLLRRADGPPLMVGGQIVVIGLAFVATIYLITSHADEFVVKVVLCFCFAGVFVYFAQALLATRAHRLRSQRAAEASVQRQKMEAIGQLAGGVAHDFNNILTVILGNLELHEISQDPRERREMIAAAREAAERARGTVAQLLSYSRKAKLVPEPRDLSDIVRDCVQMARPLLSSGVVLGHEIGAPSLPVRIDQNQMITALLNLVINARDAVHGTGRIWLTCDVIEITRLTRALDGAEIAPGLYAKVSVRDTGPGIPEELIDHVAEPFFSTKPVGAGAGLGLPMVLGFARQSGGFVQIASSEAGTEVSILLPMIAREEVPPAPMPALPPYPCRKH